MPLGLADPAAALAGAAHAALRGIYARQAAMFDNRLAEYLAGRPDAGTEPVTSGLAFGASVGQAVLAMRANDDLGFTKPGGYSPGGLPGMHDVDPLNPGQGFYGPYPGLMTPFVLTPAEIAEVMPPPPPDMGEAHYLDHYAEVYNKGVRNIGTPPRLYNNVWRPVLGIRQHVEQHGRPDAPQDAVWEPLGAPQSNAIDGAMDFTPPFPAYPSGHATFGAACFTVLKSFRQAHGAANPEFLDVELMSDELNGVNQDAQGSVRPAVVRHYGSINRIIQDNLDSRVFPEVHWRCDGGRESGMTIGERVAERVYQPAPVAMPVA